MYLIIKIYNGPFSTSVEDIKMMAVRKSKRAATRYVNAEKKNIPTSIHDLPIYKLQIVELNEGFET